MISVIYRLSGSTVKLLAQLGIGSPIANNNGLRIATMCRNTMLSIAKPYVHFSKSRQLFFQEMRDGNEMCPCQRLPPVPTRSLGACVLSLA